MDMNYITVKEDIGKGKISPVYVLYGEEDYFIRDLEQAIIRAVVKPEDMDMNLVTLDQDPAVNELVELIETVPFMGGKKLILLRDTGFFRSQKSGEEENHKDSGTNERLASIFANMPEYSYVIFSCHGKVDKRRKLFKQAEKHGVAVELSYLKVKEVRNWLRVKLTEVKKTLSSEAVEYLLAVTALMPQISAGFLTGELEKAALFCGARREIGKQDLIATMAPLPEVSVFAMLDALAQKQIGKTIRLLQEQTAAGEHPLKLIALLSRQVRLMWQAKGLVQSGCASHEVAERLGLVPFIAEKTVKQAARFDSEKLQAALLALAQADYELKTSQANCVVLEKIIIEMCS
jgi:DNA polymerase-3 subunit delta